MSRVISSTNTFNRRLGVTLGIEEAPGFGDIHIPSHNVIVPLAGGLLPTNLPRCQNMAVFLQELPRGVPRRGACNSLANTKERLDPLHHR